MLKPITKRQKESLDFIKGFIDDNGYSPTLEEMRDALNLSAVSTVHQHVEALINKGHLKKEDNLARAIVISEPSIQLEEGLAEIPLLGFIAAGDPIEAIEVPETVFVPNELTSPGSKQYALRVRGDSMKEANIYDGDTVIIKEQPVVENGEIGKV